MFPVNCSTTAQCMPGWFARTHARRRLRLARSLACAVLSTYLQVRCEPAPEHPRLLVSGHETLLPALAKPWQCNNTWLVYTDNNSSWAVRVAQVNNIYPHYRSILIKERVSSALLIYFACLHVPRTIKQSRSELLLFVCNSLILYLSIWNFKATVNDEKW